MSGFATRWRVRRVSGLLVPGFTKEFAPSSAHGVTRFLGLRVGAFDVVVVGTAHELRYRRWPVVDVLHAAPLPSNDPIAAGGYLRFGADRRTRFCRFRLDVTAM